MQQPNDKEILIDTMRKLIMTINNNKIQQAKIFDSLSKDDITKILQNFEHEDQCKDVLIKKMSARLISQLLFDNNTLKQRLSQIMQIHPINGNILLNKIPECLRQSPAKLLDIMKLLKREGMNSYGKYMCWCINTRQPIIQIKYVNLDTFSLNQFIDPNESIFGINYIGSSQIKSTLEALSFKDSQYSTNQSKYYIKTNFNQKPRLNFTSREKGITSFQKVDYQPLQKFQLTFKNDKTRFNNITDRGRHTATSPMTYSTHNKSRQPESHRGKYKAGIQITSPTSVTSNPVKFKSQKSEDRHIIILGGKNQSKQLTNSTNMNTSTPPQPKVYNFSSTKTPPLSIYTPPGLNSSTPRSDYTKITQFKPYAKQQTETKMYNDYKPSDSFLRKIKDSIKTRD